MKEPYEKGIANHSAPSFASNIARCSMKRKQGYCPSKQCHRTTESVVNARKETSLRARCERYRQREQVGVSAPYGIFTYGLRFSQFPAFAAPSNSNVVLFAIEVN
jgi:hypothetical protein